MSRARKGYDTAPLRVSAPLPETLVTLPPVPTMDEIEAELARAEVELMYAIARHRRAWDKMRRRSNERARLADVPGALSTLESDPIWKQRTGDVTWWRGEMEAQSATILALHRMRDWRFSLAAERRG